MRSLLNIRYDMPNEFHFKIAQTKEELADAYRILHDCYVEEGFMQESKSGMRITKYFALPTTTTLIALWENKVIGTMSIIRKNKMGLPLESEFDISELEKDGSSLAEVSSLAIDRKFRMKRGALFLPLCKYFFEYATDFMHIDRVVIAVNPSMADFYRGFLLFSRLHKNTVSRYDFANGAPAVGLWLDLNQARIDYKKVYDSLGSSKNLFHYFVNHKFSCFELPDRQYIKAADPVMTPELLSYFFYEKSNVFLELNGRERQALEASYPKKEYGLIFQKLNKRKDTNVRHVMNSKAMVKNALNHNSKANEVRVLDISKDGVKIRGNLDVQKTMTLKIEISHNKFVELTGIIQWVDIKTSTYGLKLINSSQDWEDYLDYLDSDYTHLGAS